MAFDFNQDKKYYSIVPNQDLKNRVEIEVGDSKDSSGIFPQVKIKRWNNEVNTSLRLKHGTIAGEVSCAEVGGKIIWQKGQYKAVFYEKPDASEEGGFEFEVHIPSRPDVNFLEFTVNTKELDWFYQPALTEAEIKRGAQRPDNVVGSYAVYHKTKSGSDYKTGKAFHLYRPHIIDSKGVWSWGEWELDKVNGVLKLVIPQVYIDSAEYPIVVDPTFGYSSIGATSVGAAGDYIVSNSPIGVTTPSTLGTVYFYTKKTTTNRNVRIALYNRSNVYSKIDNESAEVTITSATSSWIQIPVTSTIVVPKTNVSIVAFFPAAAGDQVWYNYDSAPSSGLGLYVPSGITYPTWPTVVSPLVNAGVLDARVSMYAEFSGWGFDIQLRDNGVGTFDIALSDFVPEISDAISITENITAEVVSTASDLSFSVFDDVSITEDVVTGGDARTDVFDNVTITEDIVITNSNCATDVFDSVNITESITADGTSRSIDVYESILIEDIAGMYPDVIYIREEVTVAFAGAGELSISVTDDINITESVTTDLAVEIAAVQDNINITELVTITTSEPTATVSDSINITEDVVITNTTCVADVSDSINITENVVIAASEPTASVFDNINITENIVSAIPECNVSVVDNVNITEDVQSTGGDLSISATDDIIITDVISILIPEYYISVFDNVNITENVTVLVPEYFVSVTDDINITESVTATNQTCTASDVSDQVNITEDVNVTLVHNVSVFDNVNITENVSARTHAPWYLADTSTQVTGSIVSGVLEDTWSDNDVFLVLSEEIGSPGFNYEFNFFDVPMQVLTLHIHGFYDGNAGHNVVVQQYNFTTTGWTTVGTLPDAPSEEQYSFGLISSSDYISGGQLRVRAYHSSFGNPTYELNIDFMTLVAEASVNAVDLITITETTDVTVSDPFISVFDDILITESLTVFVPEIGAIAILVTDDVNISEDVVANATIADVVVSDNINITEDVTIARDNVLSVTDDVSITDVVVVTNETCVTSVSDDIVITEDVVANAGDINISVVDNLNITEIVGVQVGVNCEQNIAAYGTENQNSTRSVRTLESRESIGISFVPTDGFILSAATFPLSRVGGTSGTMYAKIYASTGTHGIDAIPSGVALATSNPIAISNLTGTEELIVFPFSGAEQITLVAGLTYILTYEPTSIGDFSYTRIGVDTTSPTYAGNSSDALTGTWTPVANDYIFYLCGAPRTPVSILDQVDVSELVTVELEASPPQTVSVFDDITITESVVTETVSNIDVSDQIDISEDVSAAATVAGISVVDDIVITDVVTGIVLSEVYVPTTIDNITITDVLSVLFTDLFASTVVDNITITESVTTNIDRAIDVSDNITITDVVTTGITPPTIEVSVVDLVTIDESVSTDIGHLYLDISDSVTITENTEFVFVWLIPDAFEAITITENVALESLRLTHNNRRPRGRGITIGVGPHGSADNGAPFGDTKIVNF